MRVDLPLKKISCLLALGLLASPVIAQEGEPSAEPSAVEAFNKINDIKVLAQKAALPSLAGDEMFVLRESWWGGSIEPGKAKLHQVQLFKRNSYRFWLAVPDRRAELNLNVYDSTGQLVKTELFEIDGTNIVTLLVSPEVTGIYFVRVSLKTSIEIPQDYAVIYAYR
ncbi:MAG: T9SS type A sorting domain-containing protein [Verrucomicrobiales bacterium]|nr:T9SS type A sorting domain-containing protein [Verrucomicrobiales bacterium]